MSRERELQSTPLGKSVDYTEQYDPALLVGLPRPQLASCVAGEDIWNAWELSWLDSRGCPQVATLEMRVPLASSRIVESKSLKLYLNSFNGTRIDSPADLIDRLRTDLKTVLGKSPDLRLRSLAEADRDCAVSSTAGLAARLADRLSPAPALIDLDNEAQGDQAFSAQGFCAFSDRLKSNCPVTGQPDWATVFFLAQGGGCSVAKSPLTALRDRVLALRSRGEFHEQCVEWLYAETQRELQPETLLVYARYTRRGGIDINPWRASRPFEIPNDRLVRQ